MIPLRFTPDQAAAAWHEWGANCGPCAVAALTGLTLAELRPWLGDFEAKRYTNPTLMWSILDSLGLTWRHRLPQQLWPRIYGLVRVQWTGPWTRSGVPPRAAYRYTHWIGVLQSHSNGIGIWDVNALGNGTGWCALADWEATIVPAILSDYPRADGNWYPTHIVEIGQASLIGLRQRLAANSSRAALADPASPQGRAERRALDGR